tara:strand:+ start:720 stop:2312 length:1593 start_codon:yes stop_codon:yes gene_type:complete
MLGIYTRLSKEDADSNSIGNQKREGVAFATKNKFEYKLFDEGQGLSGGLEIKDRPQLLELTNAIENGDITSVWFRDQNRLERNSSTFMDFVKIIKRNDCTVYYSDEKIDYNKASVVFQGTIYSAFSQLQKDMQSEKTIRSLKDNAIEGKAHGISPYGYTKDDNGYIIIEGGEAEVVKRIYKLSLEGTGTNKIAEIFNEEGILTRYNKIGTGTLTTKNFGKVITTQKKDINWSGNTIRGIIKNTIYKGLRTLKSGTYKAPNIIVPHHWQQVNDNLKANRNNSGRVVKHKYLLKGIIKCGKCGRNYYGRTRVNKKDNFYMCSSKRPNVENCGNRSINIPALESLVWQRFFVEKELLRITESYFKDTDSESELMQIRADIMLADTELKENEKQRKKAVRLVIQGLLSEEDVASQMKELKITQNALDVKLRNLLDSESYYVNIDINKEKEIKDLNDIKNTASFDMKRGIVQNYIKQINVTYFDHAKAFLLSFIYNNIEADVIFYVNKKVEVLTSLNIEQVKDLSIKMKIALGDI